MPLNRQWRSLDRDAVASAPNRYGVVEYGDADGTVVAIESGMLRDALKDALAYRGADRVRWQETQTRENAEELAAEHRDRIDD